MVVKPPSSATSRGEIPSRCSSVTVCGSRVFSPGLPTCDAAGRIRSAGAALGVRGDLRDLRDVSELVGLAELALADRPGVGIGERDQPVGDLLAANTLPDLVGDLLAAVGELVELGGRPELGLRAASAGLALAVAARRRASLTDCSSSCPVCSVSASTSAFASPERRRIVLEVARSLRPIERERSRTVVLAAPIFEASLRPSRASERTPCDARPAVGYLMSASITVESILIARALKRRSRTAASINALVAR